MAKPLKSTTMIPSPSPVLVDSGLTENPTPNDYDKISENPTPADFVLITENPTPVEYGLITENPTPIDFGLITVNPTPSNYPHTTPEPTDVKERISANPTPADFEKISENPTPVSFGQISENPTPAEFRLISENPTPSNFQDFTTSPTPGISVTLTPTLEPTTIKDKVTVNPTPGNFDVASANPTPLGTRNPTPFGLTRNPTPLRQRREPSAEPSTASLAPTKGVPKDQTENPTPFEFGEITENPTPRLWGDLTENPTPVDFIGRHRQTDFPTDEPSFYPSEHPIRIHTDKPTFEETLEPTLQPTDEPTNHPIRIYTEEPTVESTAEPSSDPTLAPTVEPSVSPTEEETASPSTPSPTIVAFTVTQGFDGMPFAEYQSEASTFNLVVAETVAVTIQNGVTYKDINIRDVSSLTDDDANSAGKPHRIEPASSSSSMSLRASSEEVFGASSSSLSVLYNVDISLAAAFGGNAYDDGYGDMGTTLVNSVNDGQFTETLQSVASSVGASGFANLTSNSISVYYPGSPTLVPSPLPTSASPTFAPTLAPTSLPPTFAPTIHDIAGVTMITFSVALLLVASVFGGFFFFMKAPAKRKEPTEVIPSESSYLFHGDDGTPTFAINTILFLRGVYLHTKMGPKKVKMNLVGQELVWYLSIYKQYKVDISDIKYVEVGKMTENFKRPISTDAPEARCLSLVCLSTTLDLECDNSKDRDVLVENFNLLIEECKASQVGRES